MRTKKGFTLLEVLLTIILITAGFTALMQAFSAGIFTSADNENELIAMNLAQEKMEDLRNRSYANVTNEAKAPVAGFSAFEREVSISTAPPLPAGLKQVTTTVSWNAGSGQVSVILVTYISDT